MKWYKLTNENIPKDEALFINIQNVMILGYAYETSDGMFYAENEDEKISKVTHFIRRSDLLKIEKE